MEFGFLDFLLVLFGLLIALYFYGTKHYGHFRGKGVPHVEPSLPFVGLSLKVILQREHASELLQRLYDKFPNSKYFGAFEGPKPVIVLKDLELIKQLCIKDFDVFNAHKTVLKDDVDSMYGNLLVILKGEKWRDMRCTLSPAFTSSKMKNMFGFVEECSQQMAEHYVKKCTDDPSKLVEIEAKDAFSHFANDVIATTIYGLKINSLDDPNCEFYMMGKKASNFGGIQLLKLFGHVIFPKLMKLAKIPIISLEVKSYFSNLVLGMMREREEKGIVRNDMIHLLMEAKKGSLIHETTTEENVGFATVEESNIGKHKVERKWNDDELVAQALMFFVGGFDTTSTMLTFVIYELARDPDVQKRLQKEIDEFKLKSGSNLTYSDLSKFKYLDMVVSESLRLWPFGALSDRVASKNYDLPSLEPNGQPYQIRANESIWIPVHSIHRDPNHFPNPEKFDPERFSDENKSSIKPYSYIPFGIGPRNCIGSRFALMMMKAVLINMLAKFDFLVIPKTQIPVKLSKASFNTNTEKGMWVGLKLRTPNK